MEKKNFEMQSSFDNLTIKGVIFEPDEGVERKGLVHILYGKNEYYERYENFMQFLCDNGYVAVCHDHRGHGESIAKEEDRGWFGDSSGTAIVEDAVAVTKSMKEQYPNLPVTIFGHSMGSMVARCYLQENDDLINRAIICGTPNKNSLVNVAILLAKTIEKIRGDHYRSKFLDYASTGKGNKKFEKEGKSAWLSSNRENIEEFCANPKGNYIFTCNGFENLFRLLKHTYTAKRYKMKNPKLPIHFISGDEDPVMGTIMEWSRAVDFMHDLGYKNITAALYDGLRHEIVNEKNNQNVYEDILAFIEDRLECTTEDA
jgi:alpha-beta hydrolase superfamily lysophospholipase